MHVAALAQRQQAASAEVQQLLASAASPRPAWPGALLEQPQASTSRAVLLGADDMSAGLALTWLSHWQAVEADQRFQRQVKEATRGRQRRRQQLLSTWLSQDEADSNSGSSSSDSELTGPSSAHAWEAAAVAAAADPTRLVGHAPQHGSHRQAPPLSQQPSSDLEDLAWLESHPPGEAGEGFQDEAQGTAPGNQTQAWAAHAAGELVQPVQLRVGWDTVDVRAVWISVFQPEGSQTAK